MKSKSFRSTVYKLLSVLALMLVLGCVSVSAQEADGDSAHVFIFNYLETAEGDEPAIAIWLDDKVLVQYVESVSSLTERTVVPGEYSLTVTDSNAGTSDPLFAPIQAAFEAGNFYLIFAGGGLPADTGNASVVLIPLGQAPAPGETAPGRLVVANFVQGLPAVDLALDGTVVASDVQSNESVSMDAPIDTFIQESWRDPQTGDVLLAQEPPEGEAAVPVSILENAVTVLALTGKYPGEVHKSYESWLLPPLYLGEVTTIDGPEIHLGDEVAVELNAGQRIRYPLTLDKATTLHILLIGASREQDAFLSLYDAAGNLLDYNDELNFSYGDGVYDAGLTEFMLKAGTYLIEAASWGDVFPGSFTLSVK